MMICWEILLLGMFYCFQHILCVPGIWFQKDFLSTYHGFSQVQFCEIYFTLQVLTYTFNFMYKQHAWE